MDRVRKEEVRSRAGTGKGLASRADQKLPRYFGYEERKDRRVLWKEWTEGCPPYGQRVLMAKERGGRVRGKPMLGWMDGVKMALGSRAMTAEAAQQCTKDMKDWRALVHM